MAGTSPAMTGWGTLRKSVRAAALLGMPSLVMPSFVMPSFVMPGLVPGIHRRRRRDGRD